MKRTQTGKVAHAGRKLARKGKSLTGMAGVTARRLKKAGGSVVSKSSRSMKKAVKKTRSTASIRQAGKLGRAVGTFLGQAIGGAQKLVTQVVPK